MGYDLGGALEVAARVLGMRDCSTCPRAALERPDELLAEVASAVAICDEQKSLPLADVLGRELTEADHRAVATLLLSRRERRAWEIENPEKPKT